MVAAPLSKAELLARSDLAGIARVLDCHGFKATLRFKRLYKGRPRGGLLARLGLARKAVVRFHGRSGYQVGPGEFVEFLGSWGDEGAYRPGSLVETHLVWIESYQAYETAWWNGVTCLDRGVASR